MIAPHQTPMTVRKRAVCRPGEPWDKTTTPVEHIDAYETGECSEGCCAYYRCPVCGHEWKAELPQ